MRELRPPLRRRQYAARLQHEITLDDLVQQQRKRDRVGDDMMELQENDVAIAAAKEMKTAQRTFLEVERPVCLELQPAREFGLAQIARVAPYQFVLLGRQPGRDGSDAVAREGCSQVV